jgi:hypothetical protein
MLNALRACVTRDDLFSRAVWLSTGIVFGGLGVVMLVAGMRQDVGDMQYVCAAPAPSRIIVPAYWSVAAIFTAGGAVLASRCVLPARSRLARLLDRHLPDTVGLDEAIILLAIIYLPALVLVIVLRSLGIKGQRFVGR